jgi:hypothetical protein
MSDRVLDKESKKLAERIEILDSAVDKRLAREIMELFEEKCLACQEDRLSCTVRPACKDRSFLNLLIDLGVDPQDLPSFCYSQYLDEVRRYILERKGRRMTDRRLPIRDFLDTLRVSSIKHFTSRFRRMWGSFAQAQKNNLMLVAGDDLLFHFDYSRSLVILKPSHYRIFDFETFELYVSILSDHSDLESDIDDITLNWWILTITAEGAYSKKEIDSLQESIPEAFEDVQVNSSKDSISIVVEVMVGRGCSGIEVHDLKRVFDLALELKQTKSTEDKE